MRGKRRRAREFDLRGEGHSREAADVLLSFLNLHVPPSCLAPSDHLTTLLVLHTDLGFHNIIVLSWTISRIRRTRNRIALQSGLDIRRHQAKQTATGTIGTAACHRSRSPYLV